MNEETKQDSLLDGYFSCETTEEEAIQVNEMTKIQVPSPCDKCPNNKKNNPNASGICWCALPYFANPIR